MFASAFIFVPLLAFASISLLVVAMFAAHYFLTLVECGAQGQREIQWPDEAITEWFMKPVHLAWMAGLYMLPAVLVANRVGQAAGTPYVTVALMALAFAMLFPVGAVSAFVAKSIWMPFHPKAIALLVSKPIVTLTFFGLGFAACLVGLSGGFLAMFSSEIGWLGAVVGSVLAALAWFFYACSLGRLLFALTYVAPPPPKKRKKKVKQEPAAEAAPAEEDPVPHWEREKPHWDPDRDETPYLAHDAEVVPKVVHTDIVKPKESEMKLLEKNPIPPPGDFPFGPDAFKPMVQNETWRNAMILAILFGIQSGVVRLLIDLNPMK